MRDERLILKYDIYIGAPVSEVWEALTDGSTTKQYFYGCSVRSTFKMGAAISYLGDGEFNMLDGEVLEVKPETRLVTTFQARWDEKVSKDKPLRSRFLIDAVRQEFLIPLQYRRECTAWRSSRMKYRCPVLVDILSIL